MKNLMKMASAQNFAGFIRKFESMSNEEIPQVDFSRDLQKLGENVEQQKDPIDFDLMKRASKKKNPKEFEKAEEMYEKVVNKYFELLEMEGRGEKYDFKEREELHRIMIKYMKKFKGYYSLQPLKDVGQQIENTVQGIYHDMVN